jgi:hypothetical protein
MVGRARKPFRPLEELRPILAGELLGRLDLRVCSYKGYQTHT